MPFVQLIMTLINIYIIVVIAQTIMTLLYQFNVINRGSEFAHSLHAFLSRLVEPALKRIRRYVKPYNGLDFSPLILILGLGLLYNCLGYYVLPRLAVNGL